MVQYGSVGGKFEEVKSQLDKSVKYEFHLFLYS